MINHKTTFSSPILLNKYLFLKDELNQENLGVRTQIVFVGSIAMIQTNSPFWS